jgi:hypothetical protein
MKENHADLCCGGKVIFSSIHFGNDMTDVVYFPEIEEGNNCRKQRRHICHFEEHAREGDLEIYLE